MDFFYAFVYVSPARRKLAHVDRLFHRHVLLHLIYSLVGIKVVRFHGPVLPPLQLVLCDVVPPHAIHVAREGGPPRAEEHPRLGRDQLVQHAVKVGVDALDVLREIVEEHDVVVLSERLEEGLVSLVCRNIQQSAFFQLIFAPLYELLGLQPRLLILKISSSNVHAIERAICILGPFSHRLHHPGGRAHYLVNVPEVIPDEALAPQVRPPVREEDEGVEVR
mmetsp:Transcript_59332/g.126136  ORF Transcript_59332/g.126136 Transcript_59332/m.126136 type:complete len:221 (-) Transcript_59332:1234-1896(-)